MKTWCGALAVGIALAAPALAQEADAVLSVTGEGRISAAPDIATVEMGVVAEGDTPAEAIDGMSTEMGSVLTALTEAGIAPEDIQSGTLSLQPIYADRTEIQPEQGPRITGYLAVTDLSVRVRALDDLGGVLNTAVDQGANQLSGLRWALSDPQPAEDAALAAAVAEAVRKGAIMAEAAGVALGPIVELVESGGPLGGPQPMMMEARAADIPLARGEIDVTARVTVRFALPDQPD
ncbi:SIMPL domain-containing protein [Palleronia abyssalis]|uniref:26 kDa periplasmic immunogenic protein n=1 Tax=Palleronia abyssalis TaxID=1501240 RepID=A0A2R8BV27_9RHOB|nr:SIMPL domain-containing protein [Palleronia abyssalis]SPJ23946.1 26 kDa periplasmic immunogenic protein [Palleronia abyssalis]